MRRKEDVDYSELTILLHEVNFLTKRFQRKEDYNKLLSINFRYVKFKQNFVRQLPALKSRSLIQKIRSMYVK